MCFLYLYNHVINFDLLSGMIKDNTGNWTAAFYVTGSLILLSALLVLIEPLLIPSARKAKTVDVKENSEK